MSKKMLLVIAALFILQNAVARETKFYITQEKPKNPNKFEKLRACHVHCSCDGISIMRHEQQVIADFYSIFKFNKCNILLDQYKIKFTNVRQFVKSAFAAQMIWILTKDADQMLCNASDDVLHDYYNLLLFFEFLLGDDVNNTTDAVIVESKNIDVLETVTFVEIKEALQNIKDAIEKELGNREKLMHKHY